MLWSHGSSYTIAWLLEQALFRQGLLEFPGAIVEELM